MFIPPTPDDVAKALLRPLTPAEEASAEALLARAWEMLKDQSEGLEARLDDATVSEESVEQVLLQAVVRVIRNPGGHRQESKTIDDYTNSWTLDQVVSTGELYFTSRELRSLSGPSNRQSRDQAFTIAQGG